MHKAASVALAAALAAASAAFAGIGSGPPPPDAKVRDEVSFARRGALGTDSYVVTNVVPELPAFTLVTAASTQLVNRACQRLEIAADTVFVLPPPPAKREVDAYRSARSVMLCVVADRPVPRIRFAGANRLLTSCGEDLGLEPGENMFFFSEIADGDFLVEKRTLSEMDN